MSLSRALSLVLAAAALPVAAAGVVEMTHTEVVVVSRPQVMAVSPARKAELKQMLNNQPIQVAIILDEQGRPQSAKAQGLPRGLAQEIERLAASWRFQPIEVQGQRVSARVQYPLTLQF